MNSRHRVARLAAIGIVAITALAACGDDDPASEATTGSSAAPASTEPSATTAAEPDATAAEDSAADHSVHEDMPMVAVNAVDYAFEDLPATIAAGTMLSLTNTSTAELHELVAIRIPDDEQRPVSELAMLPEAEIDAVFGASMPATVIIAPPGEDGIPVLGDGSITEPGRYAVICAIPIGADPAEYLAAAETSEGPPQIAGGPPHFTAGMYAELVVE